MLQDVLKKIVARIDLTEAESASAVSEIMEGEAGDARIGAFMAALATKGETFAELAGAARAMRRKAARIHIARSPVVDTCGTGGDGAHTFNISTTAAFVAAGAGVVVAKHGNRAVSSRSGSADVLEALGVNLAAPPEVVEESVAEAGIGFLFAPLYHGAMKHAAKARKDLGIRSIFNMLGPLTNPGGATCQVIGVFAAPLTEMFAEALRSLGARRAFVVHGHDGLDEISVCADTRVTELRDGLCRTCDVSPEQLIGRRHPAGSLAGGEPAENAAILRRVLEGEPGAARDVTVVNAAAAIAAAGLAESIAEAVPLAEAAIDDGRALGKLQALVRLSGGAS